MVDSDALHAQVTGQFADFVNPYLGKLMNFAGFGVEMRAEGCSVWDHDGREFLDFLGGYGVFSLGHRHPKVVEAVKAQLDLMPLSSKVFFGSKMAELAAKIADISPEGLQYTFFSNSGTEAVECALKFAKAATGRSKIVATEGGYHGKTIGALSVTGREKYRKPFEPLMPGAHFVPYDDLDAMLAAIDAQTAAVIIETVQGEGGIHVASPGYLPAIRKASRDHGGLMIVDEVQTGLGRTGKMFGCDHEGIRPDLMTMAKCLGGGVMPIGATTGTAEVWEAVYAKNPLMHTSTFGGNPLACAAGLAAIQVIEEEGLVERSRVKGEYLKQGLTQVAKDFQDMVSEVRGQGLMVGIEFRLDEVGELTIAQMTKRGVIAAYTLNNPRVIRLEPPLVVSNEQIDRALDAIRGSLAETQEMLAAIA